MKNKYFKCSKLTEGLFRQILLGFVRDQSASHTARALSLSPKTVIAIYSGVRERLAAWSLKDCERLVGLVQVAHQAFGGPAKGGKRGRGASGKRLVLVMSESPGRTHAVQVSDRSKRSLFPAITEWVTPGSSIITDGWSGYYDLEAEGYREHIRFYRKEEVFIPELGFRTTSLYEAKSFVDFMKMRLGKLRGVSSKTFPLHLDESVFRYNHRENFDMYRFIMKLLREKPL